MLYYIEHPQTTGKAIMDKTVLEIPSELLQAARITPEEAKRELAIRLYQLHKLNDKQAGELAGDPKAIESLVWSKGQVGHFDLDDFLSWASHDLKTPLNSIIGFTKVVLKGIDGPINETQEVDLSTAFTAGQRMLALTSYLVEIARLNNGHLKLSREDANIPNLITEATNRWKIQNASRLLSVETTFADPVFNVDKAQMRQIISHLLSFASVRVTEGTVSLSAGDSDDTLKVRVQSNGKKPIDKSEMDSAMLGFITKSLIKLHGGQMDDPQETDDGLLLKFSLHRE
ncbi:MAG TPA: histidine kinase dimerization/phospho-acceptor domain-containing protein [Anaerolineales bacterium]